MTAPLTDRDHALVEAVAVRVVALLADTPAAGRLVDAATLAGILGVSRAWIYDNAELLDPVRLGDGDRPRLRFDPAVARAAWKARDPEPAPEPAPRAPRRRTPRADVALLPIAGRAA